MRRRRLKTATKNAYTTLRPSRANWLQQRREGHEYLAVMTYPKRLIEVDLPIKRISEHARREKSIRHGHISKLHILQRSGR